MPDLSGRHVVVTGAGSGIGRAIALRLLDDGAKVALMGRSLAKLEKVAGEGADPSRAVCVSADIRDREAVRAVFARAVDTFGPVHDLVANAGVSGRNEPGEGDRWDEIVRTNLDGTYFCVRAFEEVMAAGPAPRHAILISSCLARFGVPGHTAYCASKAGILGLVRALAVEWGERQILVNAINPGWVDTDMAKSSMQATADETGRTLEATRQAELDLVPVGRMAEAEEIAGLAAFLLGPDGKSFHGVSLDPNGGSWMG